MGERKGTNKYYPPDFDPAKHRSLNAYHGVHALRERGRKADKGIIIIRFEMPYNAWCLSCKKPIGMGVRYNAEKKKVGNYHSTPIFQFSMNCAMCAGKIVMQTDPQNFDYICVEGIRRKVQVWDPQENEQIVVPDYKERQKLVSDPMYHVEYGVKDKEKAALLYPALSVLESDREGLKDDFALNYLARKHLREAKRLSNIVNEKDEALKRRLSLTGSHVNILQEADEDVKKAKLMRLLNTNHELVSNGNRKFVLETSKDSVSERIPDGYISTQVKNATSRGLEKRTNAPETNEGVFSAPTLNESLSRALLAGRVRKIKTKDDVPANKKNDEEKSLSSLVAYDDSE